jgi:hypothetical protein
LAADEMGRDVTRMGEYRNAKRDVVEIRVGIPWKSYVHMRVY